MQAGNSIACPDNGSATVNAANGDVDHGGNERLAAMVSFRIFPRQRGSPDQARGRTEMGHR
jgi:hypothetical protein